MLERVGVMIAVESLEELQADFDWIVSQFADRCLSQSDLIHVLHIAIRFKPDVVDVENDPALIEILSAFTRANRDQLFASQVPLVNYVP